MSRRTWWFLVAGLVVALGLAFFVSRSASSKPDGLARVARDEGLDVGARAHALDDAPLAGYTTRGVDDDGLSTGLAGVVGVVVTFAVAGGMVWFVGSRRRVAPGAAPPAT